MKVKIYFKALLGYITLSALLLFLDLYVDANFSRTLFVILVLLIVLSIVSMILSAFFVEVKIDNPSLKIKKKDTFCYIVSVFSRLPISLSLVEIKMKKQEYLSNTGKDICIFTIDDRNPAEICFEYKGNVFGEDILEIEYVAIRDFMGICKVQLKVDACKAKIQTLPEYKEITYDKSILQLSNYTADFDDSEEVTGTLHSVTGFPGYEHREYMPGDSLKRVNFKLSAKKEKMLVRLDEPVATMRQGVILSNLSSGDRYKDEIAIEGLMSYVGFLFGNSISCEVYFDTFEGVKMYSISSDKDFSQMMEDIGNAVFRTNKSSKNKIKIERADRLSSVIVFTSNRDYRFCLYDIPNVPLHVVSGDKTLHEDNVMYINKNLMISMGGESHE